MASLACGSCAHRREENLSVRGNDCRVDRAARRKATRSNAAGRTMIEHHNLFVPSDAPDYDMAVEFTREADQKFWCTETRKCFDGRLRAGIWLPEAWWFVRKTMKYKQWHDNLIKNPGFRKWKNPDEKPPPTEAEREAYLTNARAVGETFKDIKLSKEAEELLHAQ